MTVNPLNTASYSANDVKDVLHQALSNIPSFSRCALLDHPSYFNIGDHLIWLGSLLYIRQTRRANIDYIAPADHKFSHQKLMEKSPEGPIFLNGGGNLGDIWPELQLFRESIITKYPDRPIVILPQTIYFSSSEALDRAAKVFNGHPNLILFVRDNRSYETAKSAFSDCQVYKSPDMAFHMAGISNTELNPPQSDETLYLCRGDREMDYSFKPEFLGLDNVLVDDWVSFGWWQTLPEGWMYVPGLTRLVREVWQRGISNPGEWLSRQQWQWFHP
ncbi:MAG: polysaccharide pyruvyl transferase family protein, partial [Cyanobacteria bacterium P01_D01_bin.73]